MKLYDFPNAPNPRRVRVVAAEKGIELDYVTVDMTKREHKSAEFMQKNPAAKFQYWSLLMVLASASPLRSVVI
ncbi:MAG: hypothetical protein CM15mP120_28760 [Pseudomonadota bacterium]|nr:MAG: hypothetical protein CM15mP120_28760 [Pseudomonadota bacterium]